MNKQRKGLILALASLFAFWYLSGYIFGFEIGGFDLPLIGHISGWMPLAEYSQYGMLMGGAFAVIIYYMVAKTGGKEK